jgi:predicted O-methyltransferase YrrM
MSFIPSEIEAYCINHSSKLSDTAQKLFTYTKQSVHGSNMLIGEIEGSFIQFIIRVARVKNVLEFGTYTGFSALLMAEALPADGFVTTLDINSETSKIAKSFWDQSPAGKKIKQILGPALDSLRSIDEKFDFIFIDADKNNYSNYLQWSLDHLTPHGFIISDNTLWKGKVTEASMDKQTFSIHQHNEFASQLNGYTLSLLPIRDGMFLITKN